MLDSFGGVAFTKDVIIGGVFGKSGVAIKSFFGFDSLEVMAGASSVEERLLANGYLSVIEDERFGGRGVGLI